MTEVARTQGTSSEIERGVVPEVAALGNVLKELFNKLGISQNQYAHRIHVDKSVVSRFLGGRRVASEEFVERLIAEVGIHVGAPVKPAAKAAIRARRLEALSVTDPEEFRLESLRAELERSRRDTDRAHRNVEALHDLLQKREAQARAAADELDQLRLDWGAEIARLRQDLRDAEHLRVDAERRGAELRDEVLRLEEELSRRRPAATGELPLGAFKGQLAAMWEAEDFSESARELTEAAWSRPVGEAGELLRWLAAGWPQAVAEQFVADVARLRPVGELPLFAREVRGVGETLVHEAWAQGLSARMTERDAGDLYEGLRDRGGPWGAHQADHMLALAIASVRDDPARVVGLAVAALGPRPGPYPSRTARVLSRELPQAVALHVLVGLVGAGRPDLARHVAGGYCDDLPRYGHFEGSGPLHLQLQRLGEDGTGVFLDVMGGLEQETRTTRLAENLAAGGDRSLLDRFLAVLDAHGRLGGMYPSASAYLKGHIDDWRASRLQ
ncbi:helix-turn-helix domain-containing protein [Streptomyces sp. NPDC004327]|uniref:helix-turn-helix domain-containing protein n=1 Tax=Streptomyces sp. NPDC004327 TaxID=3364699 RepID=UPI00369C494F